MMIRVTVQTLEDGVWVDVGEYESGRAKSMALLLRREGKIVRTEADRYHRTRIGWVYEARNNVHLGRVDGIDIFILALISTGPDSYKLYTRLPGHDGKPVGTLTLADGKEAAEQQLNTFIWRMGVTINE